MSKPKFEEIFSIFQMYQIETIRIVNRANISTMEEEFKRAREKLRLRLVELGLAEHIDWSE